MTCPYLRKLRTIYLDGPPLQPVPNKLVFKAGLLGVVWQEHLLNAVDECVALLLAKMGVNVYSDEFRAEVAVQHRPKYERHPHIACACAGSLVDQTLWPCEVEPQLAMSVEHICKHSVME